jgi:hypothetical protein
MQGPPLEVADLVRAAGERFLESSRGWLSGQHRKVLSAITRCRTAALGAHRLRCEDCDHSPPLVYNSCLDRHCPQCQAGTRKRWLQARRKELLPVRYLHVVFTLPRVLSQLALQNKDLLYALLMKASAQTLLAVARDPRWLGAQLGFLSILHTWSQLLQPHAHTHLVVPAGGLSLDHRRWIDAPSENFFLPQAVLAEVFRGKFVAGLKKAFAQGKLHLQGRFAALHNERDFQAFVRSLYRTKWVVEVRPPFGGAGKALEYLSRYTHRSRQGAGVLEPLHPPGGNLESTSRLVRARPGHVSLARFGPREPTTADDARAVRVPAPLPVAAASTAFATGAF